ncbi:MAG: PH domain-containing protein [Lachnospiraceae bacterium]|nr:PH domain-containing protein [Lachnospiraceae bacterium]MBQ7506104.1 PH domain-containing protein [Lachnospiraceae bacterium]
MDTINHAFQDEEDRVVRFRERKRLAFFGLPWTFTVYTITNSVLRRKQGFFKTVEDDCYLYRIQDVRLTRTLGERMFGTGTVICYSGDPSDPELRLIHVKHSREIKDFILSASEQCRIKRRTVSMQHIDAPLGHDEMDMF